MGGRRVDVSEGNVVHLARSCSLASLRPRPIRTTKLTRYRTPWCQGAEGVRVSEKAAGVAPTKESVR